MQYRPLGKTGISVSAIGLGGAGLSGSIYGAVTEDEATETVHRALDLGINFIDTARAYGASEERLGRALEGRREGVVLATKSGAPTYDGALRSVEESLRLLRTDHLELLQYHDINPNNADQALSDTGALGALRRIQEEGVADHLGITGRDNALLARALRTGAFATVLTYLEYNPLTLSAQEHLFPVAEEMGAGVILGSPLAMGLLCGSDVETALSSRKVDPDSPRAAKLRRIYALAVEHDWSVPELSLAFELSDPRVSVIIPGAKFAWEVEQNVAGGGRALPEELVAAVREIAAEKDERLP